MFLSARDGAKRLRTRANNIGQWFDELEHYGFLVMLQGHHLGSDGEGQSAHYRLTDRYFHNKPPTRDFEKWSGEIFSPKKRACSEAEKARLNGLKKQNPVSRSDTLRITADNVSAKAKRTKKGNNRNTAGNVSEELMCITADNVSRITTRSESSKPWYPENWTSKIIEGVAPHPDDIANGEADSPLWVDAWLEQLPPAPTLSLAEIRSSLGYRQ